MKLLETWGIIDVCTPSGICIGTTTYPHIYMPDPSSITLDAQGYVIPRAIGMPITESTDNALKQGGFLFPDSYNITSSLGPSLAPGSTHSYEFSGSSFYKSFMFSVFGANRLYPRWMDATYLRASTWARYTGFPQVGGYPTAESTPLRLFGWFGNDYSFGYILHFDIASGTWSLGRDSSWLPQMGSIQMPVFNDINPYDGQPIFTEIDIQMSTKTLIVTINNIVWTWTDPIVWPTPPMPRNELINETIRVDGFMMTESNTASTVMQLGETMIDTDVPWCEFIA